MSEDFLTKASRLADKTDEILPKVLETGAEVVEDGGAPAAIGFRAKKANGKYRYFWLYRVIFGIPATNLTTKGERAAVSAARKQEQMGKARTVECSAVRGRTRN